MFDPSHVWQTKEANAFSAKYLTLIPDPKKALESDLVMESFLKDYEKVPGYKSAFEFKNKMFSSMSSQRTALVPLFKLGDDITQIKRNVEDTMGSCRAVIAPQEYPDAGHSGWGGETVTAVYRPCLLYTSPSPRDGLLSRMPSSA